MIPTSDVITQRMVASGQYERALAIPIDASRTQITRAHIRKLHQYSHCSVTREALNKAKAFLLQESPLSKAQRLLDIGEMQAAFVLLKNNMPSKPTAHDYYMLGYTLYRMDRYSEAIEYYENAFLYNQSPFHAIWLGCALERQGKLEQALEKFLYAVEHRGNETDLRMVGNTYFYLGDLENSKEYLGKSVALGCTDEDVVEKLEIIRQKQKVEKFRRGVRKFLSWPKTSRKADNQENS